MVGWHHQLSGYEFEQALEDGDGQGGLACCDSWGLKEQDTTEQSHFKKENEVVLSQRWHFQDGRSKGMGTEWDKEVVGKVCPQKRVLCLAQVFLRC